MSDPAVIQMRSSKQADAIFEWLDENACFRYLYNGRDLLTQEASFSFDNETDRTLFLLRWL